MKTTTYRGVDSFLVSGVGERVPSVYSHRSERSVIDQNVVTPAPAGITRSKTEFARLAPRIAPARTLHNFYGDEDTAALLDEIQEEDTEHGSFRTKLRARLAHIILHPQFEMYIGVVILSNFVVIALESDARARTDNSEPDSSEHKTAEATISVVVVAHMIYSIIYTIECGVRLYLFRLNFFKYAWNNFDFVMVATSILAEILEKSSFTGLDSLRFLRTMRMLRTTRVLVCFDELHALVSGLTHAMRALMSAAVLMLMVLTMWSIFAVEYLRPLMSEISSKGEFDGCSWCSSAFDNVLLSNLTFFQIISGDGWSHVARPLIAEHVWTVAVFVAVIFSMSFGLLNLIVAVIVDSASQAREADIINVAAKKEHIRAAAWDCFNDMVGQLDKNGDGEISIEELKHFLLESDDEAGNFAAYLSTMGVDLSDLQMVFELLDSDGNGSLTHTEFTKQLYQMKTQELPVTLCFVRNNVSQLQEELLRASQVIQEKLDQMLSSCVDGKALESALDPASPAVSAKVSVSHMMPTAPVYISHDNGNVDDSATAKPQKLAKLSLRPSRQPPTLRDSFSPAKQSTRFPAPKLSAPANVSATKVGNSVRDDISSRFANLPGININGTEDSVK